MRMRKGATLLELIFMIVVLSIALPILPMIVKKSSESIMEIKQATYFSTGYSVVNSIINKLWDEKNVNDVEISGKYFVLGSAATTNQNSLLDCTNNYRAGHYQEENRRKCTTTGTIVSNIGLDGAESVAANDLDDIDDFDNVTQTLGNGRLQIKSDVDFIDYKITTAGNVSTIDASVVNTTATTDIKRVTVTLTDLTNKNTDTRKEIKYYYFATNIGTDIPLIKVNN